MSLRELSCARPDPQETAESAIDEHIWSTAFRMIEAHGEGAPFKAAERALKLLAENDLEGVETWRRILRAIRQLSAAPGGGIRH